MILRVSYEMPVTTDGKNISRLLYLYGTTRWPTGEEVILSSKERDQGYLRKSNTACALAPELLLSAIGWIRR